MLGKSSPDDFLGDGLQADQKSKQKNTNKTNHFLLGIEIKNFFHQYPLFSGLSDGIVFFDR